MEETFIYSLLHKRGSFLFSIVRMLHIESKIPQKMFYSAIKNEFLRIARSTLCLRDFMPKTEVLFERMKQQGSKQKITKRFQGKILLAHPESLQNLCISCQDLLNIFASVTTQIKKFSIKDFFSNCLFINVYEAHIFHFWFN